jgi:ABC-2 type transport system ATP-binding protein
MRKVEVAILDEPTSGLDPQTTREFRELIRSLKEEGMTVLLSSHLLDLVQSICDRVALFSSGRIGLSGRVDDLMRDVLGGRYVMEVEATGESLGSRLSALNGVRQVTPLGGNRLRVDAMADIRGAVAKAIVEVGGELRSLSIGSASLEDVSTRYFAGGASCGVRGRPGRAWERCSGASLPTISRACACASWRSSSS